MAKLVFGMMQSLDGYVAGATGGPQLPRSGDQLHRHFNDQVRELAGSIYGRRMYETWYKMTQMLLTGFPLQKVLTHQIHVDDFQRGFELMESGNCGKVVCSWN